MDLEALDDLDVLDGLNLDWPDERRISNCRFTWEWGKVPEGRPVPSVQLPSRISSLGATCC